MAGTRTAPVVTGAVTSVNVTLHLQDSSGDFYTDNYRSLTAPTTVDIEALATKYQAATQATLWKVSSTSCWEGDADPNNATTNQRSTIAEGINLLYKNVATLHTDTPRLIAPIQATMQGNQDIPLLTSTEMTELIVAQLVILAGYALQSTQFTGRRERKNNPRVAV